MAQKVSRKQTPEEIKKAQEEARRGHLSAYLPVDYESMLLEFKHGEQVGHKSWINELDEVFKWMPGTMNAFYGWANDGKGTFYDFLAVMQAKFSKEKFCMMKQEDVSSTRYRDENGKEQTKITANRIHKGLVWTYTGKTPYKHYHEKYNCPRVTKDEFIAALDWVQQHFFIVNPEDQRANNVLDLFRFFHEYKGCTRFLIDPYKSIELEDDAREDKALNRFFKSCKKFVSSTGSVLDFIAHPKSQSDVRTGKDKDSPFKIVTQFMVSGGAAWDNNMDAQYSVYRPERHINPTDPRVHFHNLKQRNGEEVLAKRGVYEKIKFNTQTRRYYFDGHCPFDGTKLETLHQGGLFNAHPTHDMNKPANGFNPETDDLPF
jgi:hypothetical protein